MDFENLVVSLLAEESAAGGAGSVFGPNVGSTATVYSGDNYAPGDARVPGSLYGGVLTRKGLRYKKRKRKKKKSRR